MRVGVSSVTFRAAEFVWSWDVRQPKNCTRRSGMRHEEAAHLDLG